MSDEFDMYECIPQEHFVIQRLLAFIRERQNHCTDTECIDASPPSNHSEDGNFLMMTMMMVFALMIYLIRPESILKLTKSKGRTHGQDRSDQPPPPPPAPPATQ